MSKAIHTVLACLCFVSLFWFNTQARAESYTSQDFEFESGGLTLSGVLDQPVGQDAAALVIFVHGYGNTDVRGWNMYQDLRERFASIGIASATWDKPGQGASDGQFDANQPVEESAQEVLDAIALLRGSETPGADKIVLWGISRAGWIVPIAMAQDPEIEFWISVSGVDDQESFLYLLQTNWRIEGHSEADIALLSGEWMRGFQIVSSGGGLAEYMNATQQLRRDPLYLSLGGPANPGEAQFLAQQQPFMTGETQTHPQTGLMLYVNDFPEMLNSINADVLALFGERDSNVDWRRTLSLYEATLGANPQASLTVHSFPNGNHNIDQAETGSIAEMEQMSQRTKPEGYYDVQIQWLNRHVLHAQEPGQPQ